MTRKVAADAAAAAAARRLTYGVATDAVLTDTAIVTSGSVPDTRYQRLVAAVERAINEADPIRLREVGAPTDEYSPEIATILPRLAGVQGFSDVIDVLHEEFVRWFDQGIAGPREAYEEPARRIWAALLEYRDAVQQGAANTASNWGADGPVRYRQAPLAHVLPWRGFIRRARVGVPRVRRRAGR